MNSRSWPIDWQSGCAVAYRRMKRRDLLAQLLANGCQLLREGEVILGGVILLPAGEALCHAIPKSITTSLAKFVAT